MGHTSVTETGIQCQPWVSLTPHWHEYTDDSDFPDGSVADARNYCRNPDDTYDGVPWCITMDPDVYWEDCDVPLCGQSRRCRLTYRICVEIK